jgi:hypothetical protein
MTTHAPFVPGYSHAAHRVSPLANQTFLRSTGISTDLLETAMVSTE